MTQKEVVSYFESVVNKLWPNWKTNDAQVLAWAKALKHFDFSSVRRATEEHFTSQQGSYGRPKLYAIIEKARAYQPGKTPSKSEVSDYEPDVFIQCTEHETKPGYVFWFVKVTVPRQYRNNRDYVMRAAENMRRRFSECYGGRWITIQRAKESELNSQFSNHRAKTGSVVTQS